jgi:hypothetical protein
MIVSCRTGEFSGYIQGFDTVELCELEPDQILLIASKWLYDSEKFIQMLQKLPYKDITNRPLFLTQLIILFKNRGQLPDQPSTIYRKIIDLLLEDWDRQRNIRRLSKYAEFDIPKKVKFLSALSYYLTYKYKTKIFKTDDLIAIYQKIYPAFNLPEKQAENIAKEIETHTGIISESSEGTYEFSHLSIQEYLAANYIVKEPFSDHFFDYLIEYPAPIAIAVCLSSNPSNYLAGFLLKHSGFRKLSNQNYESLINRIIQERPHFEVSVKLGFGLIKLITALGISKNLALLLEMESVKKSFAESLIWYALDNSKCDDINFYIRRVDGYTDDYEISAPNGGFIPKRIIESVFEISNITIDYNNSRFINKG